MAQNAYFRVEHKSFNRGDWGYGRVAAHSRYGANQNKLGHVATVGIPLCRTSYDTERAILELEKMNTRKNGRLGDTLIVCFPKEVSEEHRLLMMERFLSKVTCDERTYAQAWEHTDKPGNPHFHAVVIDRDRATGESVGKFGHSRTWREKHGLERNVTEWMRMQWEATGNEFFREYGYDLQFDRRNYLERGVEEPGIHRGPMPANQNENEYVAPQQQDLPLEEPKNEVVAETVDAPITADIPVETQPEPDKPEESHTPEEPMATTLSQAIENLRQAHRENPPPAPTPEPLPESNSAPTPIVHKPPSQAAERVRRIHADTVNINYIHHIQERMNETQTRIDFLRLKQEKTEQDAAKHWEESIVARGRSLAAKERLSGLQTQRGVLKGLRVKLLGIDYTSAKRQRAEQAAHEERERTMDADRFARQQAGYQERMALIAAELQEAIEDAHTLRTESIGVHGKVEQLHSAELYLKDGIQRAIQGNGSDEALDPKEVWAAWEAGDITEDQVRAYCKQAGNEIMLMVFEAHLDNAGNPDDDGQSEDGDIELEL